MVEINHSSMGRAGHTSKQTTPQAQVYEVEDVNAPRPTQAPQQAPQTPPVTSEPTVNPNPPEIPSNKNILENLIFLGRSVEEVDVDGVKFEISTLSQREHNELMKYLYKFSDSADLFTVKTLHLAHAIRKVSGVPLEDLDLDGEFNSVYEKKMAIVDNLQLSVVEQLYDKYNELNESKQDTDTEEDVKN